MKNFNRLLGVVLWVGLVSLITYSIQTCEQASDDKHVIYLFVPHDSIEQVGMILTPDKVEVSEMDIKSIPYPEYLGGESIEINYDILVHIDNYVRKVHVSVSAVSMEKWKVLKNEDIQLASLLHLYLKSLPPSELEVALVNYEIVRLTIKPKVENGRFIPSTVFWEKNW